MGISQEELAERAGLHRTYVCDIERGARNVSLKSIEKLAMALDVSLSTLFLTPETQVSDDSGSAPPDGIVDILFVEDDPNDSALALAALKEASVFNRIHLVRDGAEALDFIYCTGRYDRRRRSDGPQMILLDLNLPKVSGLDVLRRVKSDPQTRSISVVVLTGSKFDRDLEASMRLGADSYIVKPLDFQNLSEVTPGLSLKWALLKPASAVEV